jgi:DNA-directed RNA polymerase III subunit RPC2
MRKIKNNNLLLLYLKTRGLIWQQIESFDYFLKVDLKKIILKLKVSQLVQNSLFFLKYVSVNVSIVTNFEKTTEFTVPPNECRLRDLSYSANLCGDIVYYFQSKKFIRKNIFIGRLPIMLQSKKCILSNKDEHYFSNVNECPLDPGGYFIIRGSEKIILIQEQLTLNKISIEQDYSGNLSATIYTKFKSRRSKNSVVLKNKNFYFRHNVFIEDIPLIIIFKSLGIEREQDIIEVIGTEFAEVLEHSIYENRMLGIVSKQQAILYLSNRLNLRFYTNL